MIARWSIVSSATHIVGERMLESVGESLGARASNQLTSSTTTSGVTGRPASIIGQAYAPLPPGGNSQVVLPEYCHSVARRLGV